MPRITVTIPDRLYQLLSIEADRRGTPISEEVRRAAEHFADRHVSFARGPLKYLRQGTARGDWTLEDGGGRPRSASFLGVMGDGKPRSCGQCDEGFVPQAGDLESFEASDPLPMLYICRWCAQALQTNWRALQDPKE